MNLSLPKDKIQIVLLEGIHQSALDTFSKSGYSNIQHFKTALDDKELQDAIAGAHMVGVRSRTQLKGANLVAAEKLMAVGCFCIGTNQVDLPAAQARGIPVFNAPHSNTRSVAELVIAEIVMLFRGLGDKNAGCHAGKWTKSAKNSHEVRGKKIGIIGYGHIGSQVSILAEAFGMHVFYYDVEPKLPMGNACQVDSMEELLGMCDAITLHVPQAPDTVDLMSKAAIAAMKPGSVLLNLSRGQVVDLEALAEAIRSEHVMGAGVDVFPIEPGSNAEAFESPLMGLPNVIMTPHIGGSTLEAQRNIGVEVASKLANYSDLGATIGAVNFPTISLAANVKANRLLHIHENQPGVLRQINRALEEAGANVVGQHLQTLDSVGYVVTDISKRDYAPELRERLAGVAGTIRCRILY